DDRIGYFVTAAKDFSSESKDTTFVRYINRWRLERAEALDPKNPTKLSVPRKSIKFYIEKTVPHEYRAAVQDGILEWNKAFEKVVCQCGNHMRAELGLTALAMMDRAALKPGDKITDEVVNQAIKETVMHEVGHTLGLRHNFKGSTMLNNDQLHDTKITREKGLLGSVMDYVPVNLAPKGIKQGDYYTTTIGPYDYWAIEYGYKPLTGGTEGELAELHKIAEKVALPGHDYGTDEDTFLTPDPLTNLFDLGADVLKFSQDRMLLAEE